MQNKTLLLILAELHEVGQPRVSTTRDCEISSVGYSTPLTHAKTYKTHFTAGLKQYLYSILTLDSIY